MLLTLSECRSDRGLKAISSLSPSSPEFADLINAACRKALRRGDWTGTVIPIHVCVKSGCLVFPRYVGSVRKMNLCKYNPVPINGLWYEFLSHETRECWMDGCGGNLPPWDSWSNRMNAKGYSPVFQDVLGDSRTVRAYPQLAVDIGKTITIMGLDNNNQPLRRNNGDGTWSDGITLRLANPYAVTAQYVRRVDRVVKDETQGNVSLFAWNAADAVLEEIGTYEPSETNPAFERYQLTIPCCTSGTNQSVIALVKLKFLPAKVGTDLVYLQNIDALKLMVQSIKSGEAGDTDGARQYEMDSIRELNLDLWDRDTEDKVSISQEPFSGADIGGQRCL